ncbi:MAG: ABC transporter ATP-binding protein [Verrucomicrobia bacterium]|nr:ABC transporter ATP-binding protein [Verrucomicrobiota bacterium]
MIAIEDVSKAFEEGTPPALDGITAEIPKGQIIGLVGPDGSGKTTLIRLIVGLLRPTKGKIIVAGKDTIQDAEAIHAIAGYMPQKFGLYEDLSVMQNLELYAELRSLPNEEKKETFARLLQFTGLAPFTDRLARDLSGGMKQKLGLACALVTKPILLVLDEPSVGVDPISRRELWKMVYDLLGQGISVVWSTAYLDETEKCHSVLLLSEGKLLFSGKPQDLTSRVEGKVFKITNISGSRRKLLAEILHDPDVIDGVIQGQDLRIVAHKKIEGAVPTTPRFEDAFIDILGGGPGGGSELARITPHVEAKTDTPVLAINLTKKFGSFTAVENVSFEVKKGEIFGLLGPNGAGKSTTFKMLCGLLTPTSGKALVNGLDLQIAPGPARSHIGYMAQKFSLYGMLTIRQNLEFFSGIYNLSGASRSKAIDEMIKIFSFEPYLALTASSLPLGIKQRLALACATMHHPEVLFLDEPTSGVDPIMRREFWNHINGLVEKGVTVMVTTHFMDEAEYCDRIALIYRGRAIHMDTPDHLKEIAKTEKNPNPTLEDAFIKLIEEYDMKSASN